MATSDFDYEYHFKPIADRDGFGIWDTERKCFVSMRVSGKFCWRRVGDAKSAFSNEMYGLWIDGISHKIADHPRFEVRPFKA